MSKGSVLSGLGGESVFGFYDDEEITGLCFAQFSAHSHELDRCLRNREQELVTNLAQAGCAQVLKLVALAY